MSYDKICTSNVSVVRISDSMIRVGAPTVSSYDGMRVGDRALSVESCKVCVLACFGAFYFARFRFGVQVSDCTCHTIRFILLMYPLYG